MFTAKQIFDLVDAQERRLGQVTIDRREEQVVFGRWSPGPDFGQAASLFRQFEEAAESQALSVVEQIEQAIAALGLRLQGPNGSESVEVRDVQIWSDGTVTFRPSDPARTSRNGAQEAPQFIKHP
jgi:hypothetical protein